MEKRAELEQTIEDATNLLPAVDRKKLPRSLPPSLGMAETRPDMAQYQGLSASFEIAHEIWFSGDLSITDEQEGINRACRNMAGVFAGTQLVDFTGKVINSPLSC